MLIDTTSNQPAIDLCDKMQRIVEERPAPLITAHHADFYEVDRSTLASQFSPNARFLWLLHPNGTHLGRIGVLRASNDFMKSVLNCYVNAHDPDRMELYSIESDSTGAARIRRVTFDEGHELLRRCDYDLTGDTLFKTGAPIGTVAVEVRHAGQVASGHVSIRLTGPEPLVREHAIAALMLASAEVAAKSGLFTPLHSIEVNGQDIDEVFPDFVIPELQPGRFAPATQLPAQASSEATADRPRQRLA